MESPSDETLLAAWVEGDASSGEALFERYFASLFRFFAAKVPLEAADLTQESLLACVRQARARTEFSSVRAYLFGLAHKQLAMHFRKQSRTPDFDFSTLSVADLRQGPSSWLTANERRSQLLMAMQRLSLDRQITLELYYWEDLSTEEIAEVTGVSAGTVRSRLARAREELAALIEVPSDDAITKLGEDLGFTS
ncbi:MAG: RNA polymerase sigma factor [Deltaproteobacteria bacterium]